jgi:hypothetical protein
MCQHTVNARPMTPLPAAAHERARMPSPCNDAAALDASRSIDRGVLWSTRRVRSFLLLSKLQVARPVR